MSRTHPQQLVVDDHTPGRLLSIADLAAGDEVVQSVTFDTALRQAFGLLARDGAPVHADPEFARARGFEAPIVQGLCVTSRFSRLIGMYLPGESAVLESLAFKFRKPVLHDATVHYSVTVSRIQAALQIVRLELSASVEGQPCVQGQAQCLLR